VTLAGLPAFAFGFSLLLARFGALVMVAPGLGEAQIPATMRAGLAACVAALLLPALGPIMPPPPADAMTYAGLIGAELLTGLWFGWLARLVALALPAAAQIVTLMTGLANVIAPDPAAGQTTALSRLFGLVPPLLLLSSGLYMVPVQALAASYRVIPAGAVLPRGDAATLVVSGVAASFVLAVRLAAPFLLAGTVWQIALGIAARLVPSLQVYQLAHPGQVLGGMMLLVVTLPAMLGAWLGAARGGLLPLTGG
jgi:flagellar biosynthetic protein FliR